MKSPFDINELRQELARFVDEYAEKNNETHWWRPPLMTAARADNRFNILPKIAADNHWLPKDLMQQVQTVLVFFIPFKKSLVEENHPGRLPCPNWGIAYEVTNELINEACNHLKARLAEHGYDSVVTPATDNFDAVKLRARWSHKHLGYVSGLGRFGINAQFITPAGCAGRMGSLVTDADLGDHPLVTKAELCLYKNGYECLQCMARCPVKAVTLDGIKRKVCNAHLNSNRDNRIKLGLGERGQGCAKCQVNVPCSMCDPTEVLDKLPSQKEMQQ